MSSPPRTRSRSSAEELDAVMEAVVTPPLNAGLVGASPPSPLPVQVEPDPESTEAKSVLSSPEETGPGRAQWQL